MLKKDIHSKALYSGEEMHTSSTNTQQAFHVWNSISCQCSDLLICEKKCKSVIFSQ